VKDFNLKTRLATEFDMIYVKDWLEDEYYENGETGFYCNWSLIYDKYQKGDILVCMNGNVDAPIAFMTLDFYIVCVMDDARGLGVGTHMVNEAFKYASEHEIKIQCNPVSSKPFWEKMGFEFNNDEYGYKSIINL
jgi:GNAT superfamily N-acetyltransferase